jgi:hypothetical protein
MRQRKILKTLLSVRRTLRYTNVGSAVAISSFSRLRFIAVVIQLFAKKLAQTFFCLMVFLLPLSAITKFILLEMDHP